MLASWLFAIALITAGCGGESLSVDLPPADRSIPPPRPLSSVSTWALDRFLDFNVWTGSRSGFIAIFARDGHVVYATTAGYADIEAETPMELGNRVRIASMTKPVTAVAAVQLIEEGRLGLDDPVERYIPAAAGLRVATSESFGADGAIPTESLARSVTVRDLLSFPAELPLGLRGGGRRFRSCEALAGESHLLRYRGAGRAGEPCPSSPAPL
jgi:hypothetical protein